jgi:hypothetical protein
MPDDLPRVDQGTIPSLVLRLQSLGDLAHDTFDLSHNASVLPGP